MTLPQVCASGYVESRLACQESSQVFRGLMQQQIHGRSCWKGLEPPG